MIHQTIINHIYKTKNLSKKHLANTVQKKNILTVFKANRKNDRQIFSRAEQ